MARCFKCGEPLPPGHSYCAPCNGLTMPGSPEPELRRIADLTPLPDRTDSIRRGKGPDMFGAIAICFVKFTDFTGRASRAEYWYFFLSGLLANVLVGLAGAAAAAANTTSASTKEAGLLIPLLLFLPNLTVSVRRLHDTGRSGWWLLGGPALIISGFIIGLIVIDMATGGDVHGEAGKTANGLLALLLLLALLAYAVILLIWYCTPGTRGDNRYGADPLG